jgi:hypothetical protein
MTSTELLPLFKAKCEEIGQSAVAKQIGKSGAAVSQLYNDVYPSPPEPLLRSFEEEFCNTTLLCPEMGEISLKRCSNERNIPLSASSARRIRMHNACKACGGKP